MASFAFAEKITNLSGRRYILTETDDVYTYNSSAYLYHIANLSTILAPYENIMRTRYSNIQSQEESILINKIETLKTQLIPSEHRIKRALNFLGSILKFITGTPDHDDLIEIKSGLNQLIENNNLQRQINSQFEKILETLDPKSITETLIIREVYKELESITNTINFAKTGLFYSGTLNLKDIKEIIKTESYDIPIINILEYSNIHVCIFNSAIVTIYKYPIITNKCKMYNLIPLAFKHGKYELKNKIAKCNNNFTNLSNCKNYIGTNICKIELKDKCTIPLLLNQKAQCNVIQENNNPLQILDHGNIIVDNVHIWNGQKINGPHLIQYDHSTTIDNKTYINHEQEIKDIIHAHENEKIEILNILSSESNYKFSNIQKMYKFLIPIEEHPFKFILYLILISIILVLIVYSCVKIYIYRQVQTNNQRKRNFEEIFETELRRLQS